MDWVVRVVNRMHLLQDITNEDEDQVESDVDVSDSSLPEEEWEFVESDTPMYSTLQSKMPRQIGLNLHPT